MLRLGPQHVVTCAEDDTIRVWLRNTLDCVRVIQHRGSMDLVVHPSSIMVTAGGLFGALNRSRLMQVRRRIESGWLLPLT